MRRLLLAVVVLATVAPTAALASDKSEWTKGDTALQLTYTTLYAMDWAQTLHIARNPEKYYETNPHLGKHPSEGEVNSYFAAGLVLNTAVAYALPKPWRTVWQVGFIVDRYGYVRQNRNIGIGVSWCF
jgi:hypothetical protein